jgi:integrase/recombinase XerD
MLHLYRRHLAACPHRSMDYKKCKCPVWMFGSVNGKRVRKALDTASWGRAEEMLRELDPDDAHEKITVAVAGERFIADCESRKLGKETVGKYELLVNEMTVAFGKTEVKRVSPDDLSKYREIWKLAPISYRKKLERLRTFFRFAEERGWTRHNPALKLKAPIAKHTPKLPFSDSEMEKILWAADQYPELYPMSGDYGKKVKPFILVLRYAGFRIRDCVCLKTSDVKDGKIFIYTQKTGSPVWVPIPKTVIQALDSIKTFSTYFFWSGNGLPKSAVADWQRTLARVFKAAGVVGHPHRFRHTFATTLLHNGVSIENVAVLLGHASSAVTSKHYDHSVKARQDELEAAVMKSWSEE